METFHALSKQVRLVQTKSKTKYRFFGIFRISRRVATVNALVLGKVVACIILKCIVSVRTKLMTKEFSTLQRQV